MICLISLVLAINCSPFFYSLTRPGVDRSLTHTSFALSESVSQSVSPRSPAHYTKFALSINDNFLDNYHFILLKTVSKVKYSWQINAIYIYMLYIIYLFIYRLFSIKPNYRILYILSITSIDTQWNTLYCYEALWTKQTHCILSIWHYVRK